MSGPNGEIVQVVKKRVSRINSGLNISVIIENISGSRIGPSLLHAEYFLYGENGHPRKCVFEFGPSCLEVTGIGSKAASNIFRFPRNLKRIDFKECCGAPVRGSIVRGGWGFCDSRLSGAKCPKPEA